MSTSQGWHSGSSAHLSTLPMVPPGWRRRLVLPCCRTQGQATTHGWHRRAWGRIPSASGDLEGAPRWKGGICWRCAGENWILEGAEEEPAVCNDAGPWWLQYYITFVGEKIWTRNKEMAVSVLIWHFIMPLISHQTHFIHPPFPIINELEKTAQFTAPLQSRFALISPSFH